MAHLTETVPTMRRRYGGEVVGGARRDLIAAEYRHTTARGVMDGDAPDPQLHSHVVVTSAVREDGRIVAVASRPIFRAAREVGAFYRSALAHELVRARLCDRAGTGKQGRYFEIAGVPRGAARRVLGSQPRGRTRRPSVSARSGGARPSAGSCGS